MIQSKQMVEDFKSSGKSQRKWCTEQELKRSTLRYWLKRLDELSDGKEVVFAEIVTGGDNSC